MARPALVLSAIAASAALVLTGCGSSDPTTGSTNGASTAPVGTTGPDDSDDTDDTDDSSGDVSGDLAAWADAFCGELAPVEEQFESLDDIDAPVSDPTAYLQAFKDALAGIGPAITEAKTAIEEVGPPPVDGGDEIHDAMVDLFSSLSDAFNEAGAQIAGLDPSDPESFAALEPIFTDLGPEIEALSDQLDDAFERGELRDAIENSPACDDLDIT